MTLSFLLLLVATGCAFIAMIGAFPNSKINWVGAALFAYFISLMTINVHLS